MPASPACATASGRSSTGTIGIRDGYRLPHLLTMTGQESRLKLQINEWDPGTMMHDQAPIRWPAPAKLNLFLHVNGRRPDGYHELQTLFIFLNHGDWLEFEPIPGSDQLTLSPAIPACPMNKTHHPGCATVAEPIGP